MSRRPTQHQLLKKFEELTSSNAWLQNRWMPDEEIVHSIKVHSDFAKTSSSSLNAAITKLCNFTSNCHKFDGGNTFLRLQGNFKIGSKRKRISFYFVKSTEDKVLIPSTASTQWPQIYNDFLQNAAPAPPTITTTTETETSSRKRKPMRAQSTVNKRRKSPQIYNDGLQNAAPPPPTTTTTTIEASSRKRTRTTVDKRRNDGLQNAAPPPPTITTTTTSTSTSETSSQKRTRSTVGKRTKSTREPNTNLFKNNINSSSNTNSKNSTLNPSISPFDTKMSQLRCAWNRMYGDSESFPSHVISFTDASKEVLPPAPHVAATTPQNNESDIEGVYDKKYYVVITKIDFTKFVRARAFFDAIKKGVSHKKCELRTPHSCNLLAAFAASHPQVVPANIQMCVALGRYTLLHDVQSTLAYNFDWISLRGVAQSSPKCTANYFFIAANSFIGDNNDEGTEGNADDGGDDHNDGDDDGGNNGGDGGSVYDYRRRKRDKGTKKVCDMERNLFKIETDINNIAKSNPNFNADAKFVAATLA